MADRLPIGIAPAAFKRFVWVGQGVKLGAFALACGLLVAGQVSALDLALLAGMYVLTMLGITAGYHRLFAHRSYEAHPGVRYALAALGTMAGQGTPPIWVAMHRRHHQFGDQPGDPHSPHVGAGSAARRFWFAHVGWILAFFPPADWERYVPDLLDDPMLVRMHQRSMAWVIVGVLLPAALGFLVAGTPRAALGGLLWGGYARMFLVEQSTLLVNSACHWAGARRFETADQSRNVWWVAILALGEGWHNNHHACPAAARHGCVWWEWDFTYGVIRALAAVGLVRGVVLPPAG